MSSSDKTTNTKSRAVASYDVISVVGKQNEQTLGYVTIDKRSFAVIFSLIYRANDF